MAFSYISTRGGGGKKSFRETVLGGLAEDGGLYVPLEYPQFSTEELQALRGRSYVDVAYAVLLKCIDDIPADDLRDIIRRTYTSDVFGTSDITPFIWLEKDLGLLKLSEGPTLAFKDIALQFLGTLMEYVLGKERRLTILGATSGDTGSAAECALRGRKNIRVFMLSPKGRMSPFQQAQMYTIDDPNIFNLVVRGTFDDCQRVVKEVNADAVFKKVFDIGAVNSINWARIVAQTVYYVYGYLAATKRNDEEISFVVPSGNFGNALAAYVAKRIGVPIREIIIATNENDVLDVFFRTGIYRERKSEEVRATHSPSMDIAAASNFERLVFDLVGRDPTSLRGLISELKEKGSFSLAKGEWRGLPGFSSESLSDGETIETIRAVYEKYGRIIDPHTAVGVGVGLLHRDKTPLIVVETAQPAKFDAAIREALGKAAPRPRGLETLEGLPQRTYEIEPDADSVKRFIREHVA